MKKILPIAAVVFAVAGVGQLQAQTSVSGSATVTIPTVLYISVTNSSPTFQQPTAQDFNSATAMASNVVGVLDHRGNVRHGVEIKATTDYFTKAGGAVTAKPVGDLQMNVDGSTWVPVAAKSAAKGNALVANAVPGRHTKNVAYRMLLDYAVDAPETYGVNFTYTIVQQ